jgi:hypothetical protein
MSKLWRSLFASLIGSTAFISSTLLDFIYSFYADGYI